MSAAPELSDRQAGDHPIVLPLRRLDARSLPTAGGKAANLGELIQSGLPVPEGFCVTTVAYDEMATAAGLSEIIDQFAATMPDDQSEAAELARRARERILSAPMPSHVAEAVSAAYRDLGADPVAVRSSAVAEDRIATDAFSARSR